MTQLALVSSILPNARSKIKKKKTTEKEKRAIPRLPKLLMHLLQMNEGKRYKMLFSPNIQIRE